MRDYRAVVTGMPTKEEWLQVWALPGCEGGMSVEVIEDWEEWRRGRLSEVCAPLRMEQRAEAQRDLARIRRLCARAPKRKAVPAGAAPLEVLRLALDPSSCSPARRRGVGASAAPPATPTVAWAAELALWRIRSSRRTPLHWHRSQGAALRKSDQEGPRGKRVVHVLRPFGKLFFAANCQRRSSRRPAAVHGFCKGRRRETPMLLVNLLSWKVKRLGWSLAHFFFDITNAFGSMEWGAMRRASGRLLGRRAAAMGPQRFEEATITLPASPAPFDVKPREGGPMGDPFMVELFTKAFQEPVDAWRADPRTAQQLRASWGPWEADLAVSQYADDLRETKVEKGQQRLQRGAG